MNKFISLILLALVSGIANANTEAMQSRLAAQSLLLDIWQFESGRVLAVGERGHIVFRDESSKSTAWHQAKVPVNGLLTSVFFIDEKQGWAVGHDSIVLRTQDGGATWVLLDLASKIEEVLLDVLFFDEQNGLVVGGYGAFYRTADGGNTWQKELKQGLLPADDLEYLAEIRQGSEQDYLLELSAILPHLNQITASRSGDVLLIGERGLFAVSQDKGQSFKRTPDFYHGSLFDVIDDGERIWAGGMRGNLFYSNDGINWQPTLLPQKHTVNKLLKTPQQIIIASNNQKLWFLNKKTMQYTSSEKSASKLLTGVVVANGQYLVIGDNGVQQLAE